MKSSEISVLILIIWEQTNEGYLLDITIQGDSNVIVA